MESKKERLKHLMDLVDRTLASKFVTDGTIPQHRVSAELFAELRTSGLSFFADTVGQSHPYYLEFESKVKSASVKDSEIAKGIFRSAITIAD